MSPAVKNGVLLAVLIVAVGAAGLMFSRSNKANQYPTDGPKTRWMCDTCGKQITLNPAEYKDWYDSKDKRRRDPNFGPESVFWCDQCKKFSVVRAFVQGGKWVFSVDSQGNPVKSEGAAE
jgi:hypothetical protein